MRKAAALLGLVMLAPFLYMVAVSLTGPSDVMQWPSAPQLGRYLLNTVIVGCIVVTAQLFTSAAAGYALARLRFPGREPLYTTLLWLLAIPAIALVIPRAAIVHAVGGADSYAGLASAGLVSLWGVILLRHSFLRLPRDVEDAARLDGAGEWTVFWRVALPRVGPALIALAAVAFVDWWKNLIWPLAVTRTAALQVAEVGLARLHETQPANWPYLMAAAVTASVPPVIVLLFAQRSIVTAVRGAWSPRGIAATS